MEAGVTIDEFKERLIVEGVASVEKNETRPERLMGGKAGFELCRSLNTMADFKECLVARHAHEHKLRMAEARDGFWEYRYATIQVEYVYERMLVAWSRMGLYSGPLSARAVLRAADIIGVKGQP